ncbi:MAG TPA: hypothetical protein VF035_02150 [Longimicrobiales bacterium]
MNVRAAFLTLAGLLALPCTVDAQAPARVDHGLVYDAARKVVVMYGGGGPDDAVSLGSTWAFDGASWKLIATDGPGQRSDVRLAYDAARDVVVLYGGRARGTTGMHVFTDTWEWNGAMWRKAADGGPPARTHAALGYDPLSRRVLLYGGGGTSDESYNDTWSWDGAAWKLLPDTGPAGRFVNGMTTTAESAFLSLVYNAPETMRDGNMGLELFRRDAATWSRIDIPPLRFSPMMPVTATANAGELLLYAGWDAPDGAAPTTWLVSARGATREADAAPGRRRGAAMAYDPDRRRVILFGGESDTAVLNDTWEWYDGAWHRVPQPQ